MTTNTELLRELLRVVNQHTIMFENVDERLIKLEARMETVETRLTKLETKVSNLDTRLTQYVDKNSKIQENISTELIFTLLNKYIYRPLIIPIREFYDINGYYLTDFDGCMLLYAPYMRNQNNQFKNNYTQINPDFKKNELVIIEAKRNTTKKKVDTKLLQLIRLSTYLKSLSTLENAHCRFKQMVKEYRIDTWPKEINLIFATDDITLDIKIYIQLIHDGITKEKYDQYAFRTLRSDLVYQEFILNKEISSSIKHKVKHSKTLDELYANLTHESIRNYTKSMLELIPPYSVLQPSFELFRGHIGYAQFNTLIFPRLLPFNAITPY
jgi:hypothetical protein